MDPAQFRAHVIGPSLRALAAATNLAELWSPAAEVLLLGTALQESELTWLVQLGDASGRGGHGPYQDEPEDLADLLRNFAASRPVIAAALEAQRRGGDDVTQLEWDLRWATWVCRLHYYREPFTVPAATDGENLAQAYKTFYNTALGAADMEHVKACMARAIATST